VTDKRRTLTQTGGWAVFGGSLAVATGATPIGVAVVAGLGGALAWRALGARFGRR
jgi:hypothetical protein